MSMKNWRIIYKSYHDKATYYNIFIEKNITVNLIEGIILFFIIILCLFSIVVLIFDRSCHLLNIICNQYVYFAIAIICVVVEMLIFNFISNRLPIYTYKDKKRELDSYPPDVNIERYFLFKNNLQSHQITKNSVEQGLKLADMKIDIISSDKFNARIADLKFLLGFGLGILGTLWKQLQPKELIIIFLIFCLGLYLLKIILFVIPSKIEKAKELKYFMMLYLAEKNIPGNL